MCIAIFKEKNQKCPSMQTLRNCWESNDDGAGYAFAYNGTVKIKKGFLTFDAFRNSFEADNKKYNFEKLGMLIHFRISTVNGISKGNTHPFPMSNDTNYLQKPETENDYAVIHNGIISLTSATATAEKTTSDTLVFVRDYLWNIAQNRGWFRRESNIDLIYRLAGSKIAILNRFGEIIHTPGFTEDNGVWYSNDTYKSPRIRYNHAYGRYNNYMNGYNCYDYDYDWYGSNYRNYRGSSQNTGYSQYHTIPLMKCEPGDTISGDSVEDTCTTYNDVQYALSKEGFLYYLYKEDSSNLTSLEFLGMGVFYDKAMKERPFVANYWPREEQFLGDEYPGKILCGDDEDVSVYDDADYSKKKETEKPENSVEKKSESETQIVVVNNGTENTNTNS